MLVVKLQVALRNSIGIKHSVTAIVIPIGTVVGMDVTIDNEMTNIDIFGVIRGPVIAPTRACQICPSQKLTNVQSLLRLLLHR